MSRSAFRVVRVADNCRVCWLVGECRAASGGHAAGDLIRPAVGRFEVPSLKSLEWHNSSTKSAVVSMRTPLVLVINQFPKLKMARH